jgi:hypothetical protein
MSSCTKACRYLGLERSLRQSSAIPLSVALIHANSITHLARWVISIEGVADDKSATKQSAADPDPKTKRSWSTRTLMVRLTKIAIAKSKPAK